MMPTLWLYEPGSPAVPAGRIEIDGGAATLHEAVSPSLASTFDQLVAMPALPLLTEAWEGDGAGRQLVMKRTLVRPGDEDWHHALAQNLERVAVLDVRTSPLAP